MKTLGIILCLISVIILSGLFIKFMFNLGVGFGLVAIALILGAFGMCIVEATE